MMARAGKSRAGVHPAAAWASSPEGVYTPRCSYRPRGFSVLRLDPQGLPDRVLDLLHQHERQLDLSAEDLRARELRDGGVLGDGDLPHHVTARGPSVGGRSCPWITPGSRCANTWAKARV